jgi:hypothetical protein
MWLALCRSVPCFIQSALLDKPLNQGKPARNKVCVPRMPKYIYEIRAPTLSFRHLRSKEQHIRLEPVTKVKR